MRTPLFDLTCPYCGEGAEDAFQVADWEPSPGDVFVCLHCAEVGRFTDQLRVRRLVLPDEEGDLHQVQIIRWRRSIRAKLRQDEESE